jgi:type III restriction enzyme
MRMSSHPVLPFDQGLLDDIAARMELRTPNSEALTMCAHTFDKANGEPFEVVCDLATAVGKTYLAGGLIEYLAESGVRNFLIVVPGRTILTKTVANLTAGHPKSILGGMETNPVVVTAQNFNTPLIGAALNDPDQVKVFVFTVQALLKPDKNTRRVRVHQEWLGDDLYEYMRGADDLVVLADECHVYSEKAKSFSAAVRDLTAMALIGLTATPDKSDADKVIYHYPLARAIAERYVKTPVLVGRKDDATDVETRLRDGMLLLQAKQTTADAYAVSSGKPRVNAVMFVVADTIDKANAVAEILRKPGLFPDNYDEAVLTIHSEAPDDALARLAAVEELDSKVRVIVSVSMLKEGWDVKNIFVICSLRPSISDVLTEQTLGRGLRLPWGAYTDVELLDTVEVLSHERYEFLLSRAGVLLQGLTDTRAVPAVIPRRADGGQGDTVLVVTSGDGSTTPGATTPPPGDGLSDDLPVGTTGFVLTSTEQRSQEAADQAGAVATSVLPSKQLELPRVTRTVTARSFSLSDVPDGPFADLGKQLGAAGGTTLARKRLDVVADPTAPTGYRLVPSDATTTIDASTPQLPIGGALKALQEAICNFDLVTSDKASLTAAKRLAQAAIDGAGSEEALSSYLNAAIAAANRIITKYYRAAPEVVELTVSAQFWGPTRVNTRKLEQNRFGPFSRKAAYGGWKRGLYPLDWFDSEPERAFANMVDSESKVEVWCRIQRGELAIDWEQGRYTPDFYVAFGGTCYLVEVKSDKDAETPLVQSKKKAAERWARKVSDAEDYGSWHYLLVSEAVLHTAKTFDAILTLVGTT